MVIIKLPKISECGKIAIKSLPASLDSRRLTAMLHNAVEKRYPEWDVEYGTSLESLDVRKSKAKAIRLYVSTDQASSSAIINAVSTTIFPKWLVWVIALIVAIGLRGLNIGNPILLFFVFYPVIVIVAYILQIWFDVLHSFQARSLVNEFGEMVADEFKKEGTTTATCEVPTILRTEVRDKFILSH